MIVEFMLIGAVILILLSILFALPVLGVGLIIPGVGDVIDIPIAFVFAGAGILLLFLALGLGFIVEYWWLLALIVVALVFLSMTKLGKFWLFSRGRR